MLRTDPIGLRRGPQYIAWWSRAQSQLNGLVSNPCQVSWANVLNPSALHRYFTDSSITIIICKGIPIKHLEFMACREISVEP